ncbi:MAG: DEDD exonuclease domain-containing protein [Acidimicrobiia bacterium]
MQRSFDDLGTPLHDVTFVVVDLETTGGSPATCGITEVGAVKLRGGEQLGTVQTLVDPGRAIPPSITVLTGITQAMVLPAPPIEEVLPSLLEFIGDAVVVGHNVRFDLRFLDAALARTGRPRISNRWVDTAALARRLVREEVPDLRLSTLAERFRLARRPTHRALDDALATGELLHVLIERTGRLGVTGLDDLLALPRMGGHPQVAKLALTDRLPRAPGVYTFRDPQGRALYVGKATNLRTRVRSYFSSDDRRKIGPMLREAASIDHVRCSSPLEAAVLEVRTIHALLPRYNRQLRNWRAYAYVKLTDEAFPRLSVVRTTSGRRTGPLLGPLPSGRVAQLVVDAVQSAVPVRRCNADPRRQARGAPCASAQLGAALCPCAGGIDETTYRAVAVDPVVAGWSTDPEVLLAPLRARMARLAHDQRFEEAAEVRDRAGALARALRRQRRLDALRAAGRLVVELADGSGAELRNGALVRSWGRPRGAEQLAMALDDAAAAPEVPTRGPLDRAHLDELAAVAHWLDQNAGRIRIVEAEHGLWSALPAVGGFEPVAERTRPAAVAA